METNDQILRKYFKEKKTEISDDGFSLRVAKALPEAPAPSFDYLRWALTVMAVAAVSLFFLWLGPELASKNLASLLSGYETINKVTQLMGASSQGLWGLILDLAHASFLNIAIAMIVLYFLAYKEITYRLRYQE